MTGDPCVLNTDCASGFCLPDPFQGGYCSSDCSTMPCGGSDVCKSVSGFTACLKTCASAGDCRTGYMCFGGECRPPCAGDLDCGKGFMCASGSCQPLPGKSVGMPCASDMECSSRLCDPVSGDCQVGCASDADCQSGQTCWVNPVDRNGDGSTDGILPICIKRRGSGAPGSQCKFDSQCDQGQCELGVCVQLCQTGGNCAAMPPMACVSMVAQVDIGAPPIKGCILKSGTLTYNLGNDGTGPVGVPGNTLGFNIFVEAQADNISYYAGITDLEDPTGTALFALQGDFFGNPIRYYPTEGSSMVLVSNAPNRVSIIPGLYTFSTFTANIQSPNQTIPYTARVRFKLGEQAPTAGTIPLHVFVTSLSGGCTVFDAASAPQRLSSFEAKLKQVYAQAGLTISPIVYMDSTAPNLIGVGNTGVNPQLDSLLKTATTGDMPDALEMVVVKHINSSMQGFEILGYAGGIPASTGIPGTVHSGVAVSLTTLCTCNFGQDCFAETAAHELGHSLGLFHTQEQNGQMDPLSDTKANPTKNLMYWEEGNSLNLSLTPQQSQVILANPAVE